MSLLPLARALADVGRAVRSAVLAVPVSPGDARVVRHEGGDDIFGLDQRADEALLDALTPLGATWPGRLVMEGFAEPLPVGDPEGPWVYLADPVDGTRPWLAGKRSAWVLLGAGREARTLEDLEVGAAVELPTERAALGLVTWAAVGEGARAEDDDLVGTRPPAPVELGTRAGTTLSRAFVTVARIGPGTKEVLGRFEDELLSGEDTYEDPYLSSGGQLVGLATGADAAVLDPRPLFGMTAVAHPYDLAALVVAREAGVLVEALPPGPLTVPLDPEAPVAWGGYANEAIAERLRGALPAALRSSPVHLRGSR